MSEVKKSSLIQIKVELDDQNMPVHLAWKADDNPSQPGFQDCKALLLSLFDRDHKDTLKIDLWTKDMQVVEMDRFFYQTLRGLTDSYFKATQNHKLASEMQQFVEYFGKQTEILPK